MIICIIVICASICTVVGMVLDYIDKKEQRKLEYKKLECRKNVEELRATF